MYYGKININKIEHLYSEYILFLIWYICYKSGDFVIKFNYIEIRRKK
ncbi:hypothetical protein HMPREF1123_02956 [Clostridioides difficile 050-P50-2011]|nr:hypothetical protein HMPREF1123_02956 [Clostridioides difficile 050-P50-2011]